MMDAESKQRHRRRKRAQRMALAQREMAKDGDSAEDESPVREKPQRPPNRRKKSKEPLAEEDIIDGFAILGFKSYEDLELALKLATKENVKRLTELERPKHESRPLIITHHISAHHTHSITLSQDPATSDDSGRASERLTSSSVAPRDADSSRDRLSDASSRCSSGKGYICDSEGDDDKDSATGQEDVGQEKVESKTKEGHQETVETPLTSPAENSQGSDASSVIFGSAPASRKHEFPGALPPSLPQSNGTSNSPVPAPTPPDLPAPSPAPAQLPPPPPQYTVASAAVRIEERPPPPKRTAVAAPLDVVMTVTAAPNSPSPAMSAPPTVAQQPPPAAVAPVMPMMPPHDHAATSNRALRTESPAVATSAPAYHAPYQPLYTPYSQTPYSVPPVQQQQQLQQQPPPVTATPIAAAVATTVATQASAPAAAVRPPSPPRGHSPTRERESYSSNVSSLSRSSVPPPQGSGGCQPPVQVAQPTSTATTVSSSLNLGKSSWSGPTPPQLSPAPPRPTPPLHQSFPPPMFTAPLPPSSSSTVSRASPLTPTVPQQAQPPPPAASNPNPFSAESLFQTNQTDMLRRELDNRFLATQDRSLNVAPPPYLRTEMHQHQHHHTHVHQHTTSLLAPPSSSTLFTPPMFKEIPKLGSVESPFYRQNIGMPNYPGYTPSLLHPGLTAGPTPFVPPNHLGSFQPKTVVPSSDPSKPKTTKTGKWNAMHVRIAWEIYHHQQKSGDGKSGPGKDLLRPPTHLFSPSVHQSRPHELPFPPSLAAAHRPPPYEQPPHHGSLFAAPGSHISRSTISPFTRYGAGFGPGGPSPFGPFGPGRDLGLQLHDPWRGLQRTVPSFPSVSALPPSLPGLQPPGPWSIKPDPMIEQREREERERQERERERLRREREERERREREEKQRRLEQQQQQERERERREKERLEQERREREQRERERLLHQQRLAESKQMAPVLRDRSPHRNGLMDHGEIRIKEEPRTKEEDPMPRQADPRFHPYLRPAPHQMAPPPPSHMLDRSRMLSSLGHHYQHPQATHWPPPTDPFYRYDHLRYNPLMDVMRVEEERAKLFGGYPPHPSQLRAKDPGLMHLRPGHPQMTHKMCGTPPTDLHKKEEPR